MTQGAPRAEELISLQRLIENIALLSEVSDEEVRGRCSPNMRGEEASFEYALRLGAIRGMLSEKAAVIQLLNAFNASIENKPSFYLLYDGHAIEDDSIKKDLNFYLLHLKLTRYIEPQKGGGRWDDVPPPQGMAGKFDFEKIRSLYFKRDQIRNLLDECHIKHSVGASSSSPSSTEDAKVVGEQGDESKPSRETQLSEAGATTEKVVKKQRGRVAALEKEYLEAQRRAINEYDFSEIHAHLFNMGLEDGAWSKLVVEDGVLYQIDTTRKQRLNKSALRQWLAKRRKK